jgi:hypothetical protein
MRSAIYWVSFAKIASGQKRLTFAQLLAILQAMRDALLTVAALRSALSTRRDILLENLALRHQLGVLARSDRRFRRSMKRRCSARRTRRSPGVTIVRRTRTSGSGMIP